MSLPWFRLYAEFATDPVVQSLAFDDQRHFVILLCLKCSGALDRAFGNEQARTAMLRRALGLEALAFDETKNRLCASGLITGEWQPKNWEKRQFHSDHSAAERMRNLRKRNRDATVTSHVTKSDVPDTDTDTDTDRGKSRIGARTKARAQTATRLPPDFDLTPERMAVAETEGVDSKQQFARFVDYWKSSSGAHARKHDWDATWRNWCRKAADMKQRPGLASKKSLAETNEEHAAAWLSRQTG